jgi:hypothetical protein
MAVVTPTTRSAMATSAMTANTNAAMILGLSELAAGAASAVETVVFVEFVEFVGVLEQLFVVLFSVKPVLHNVQAVPVVHEAQPVEQLLHMLLLKYVPLLQVVTQDPLFHWVPFTQVTHSPEEVPVKQLGGKLTHDPLCER